MQKIPGYPIVVNYNLHTRKRNRSEEIRLHEEKKYEKERELSIKIHTTSDSEIENNLWKTEIDQFETTVVKCLQRIERNPVGRMVLGLINKQTTVWIVPKSDDDLKQCSCALTGPLKYEIQKDGSYARGVGSGDTVILFHPALGDDTLFHELVHAYRYSYKKFYPMTLRLKTDRHSENQSSEEFFAHQMENMYMSHGNGKLKLDYNWAWTADKKTIYDFLLENVDALMMLKYFLRHEYMAMLAANGLTTAYNPFRDYKTLEATFVKGTSLRELPEFGAVLDLKPGVGGRRR